jgi:hypothetical protein
MKTNKKGMLTAAVTGILLGAAYAANSAEDKVDCHGVNACKGQGDCAGVKANGEKHGCAGQNECMGKGTMKLSKEECSTKGGTVE